MGAEDEGMDKYAVVTKPPDAKTASGGPTCPTCGSALDKAASAPRCPKCGTKPFEKTDG